MFPRTVRSFALSSALLALALGAGVARADEAEEEFRQKRAALGAKDVEGRLSLAEFAIKHRWPERAGALGVEAWAVSPRDKGVLSLLAKLDYHVAYTKGGTASKWWLAPAEFYPAHGFVQQNGAWLTKDQAAASDDIVLASDGLKAAETALRDEASLKAKVKYAEGQVASYKKRKENIKKELEKAKKDLEDSNKWLAKAQKNWERYKNWSQIAVERKDAEADLDAAEKDNYTSQRNVARAEERQKDVEKDDSEQKLEAAKAAYDAVSEKAATAKDDAANRKKEVETARAKLSQADADAKALRLKLDNDSLKDQDLATDEQLAKNK